jgi:hypothetical protein
MVTSICILSQPAEQWGAWFGVECGGAKHRRFGLGCLGFGFGALPPHPNRKNQSGGAKHRHTPHQTQNNRNLALFAQR